MGVHANAKGSKPLDEGIDSDSWVEFDRTDIGEVQVQRPTLARDL